MKCVNLAEKFGDRYGVTWDPAYDPVHLPHGKSDPWYMQIPCERGIIYPHGGDLLAVEVDFRPQTAKKLEAVPGVERYQDGDHEKTYLFPVAIFDQVAAIVRPRKRRRRPASAAAHLVRFRFGHAVQSVGATSGRDAKR